MHFIICLWHLKKVNIWGRSAGRSTRPVGPAVFLFSRARQAGNACLVDPNVFFLFFFSFSLLPSTFCLISSHLPQYELAGVSGATPCCFHERHLSAVASISSPKQNPKVFAPLRRCLDGLVAMHTHSIIQKNLSPNCQETSIIREAIARLLGGFHAHSLIPPILDEAP